MTRWTRQHFCSSLFSEPLLPSLSSSSSSSKSCCFFAFVDFAFIDFVFVDFAFADFAFVDFVFLDLVFVDFVFIGPGSAGIVFAAFIATRSPLVFVAFIALTAFIATVSPLALAGIATVWPAVFVGMGNAGGDCSKTNATMPLFASCFHYQGFSFLFCFYYPVGQTSVQPV